MRFGSISINVTGMDAPSSVKTRDMPHLRPTNPMAMRNILKASATTPGAIDYFKNLVSRR
jgi:hypothetical protein